MKGYLHSIESFSTLDGPGIRSVVFFQGCPLRCRYCHNPDTWAMNKGLYIDTSDIIDKIFKNIRYIGKNGGVTISGGEPTAQIDFLAELLKGLKAHGLHTAVDTSGYVSLADINKIIGDTDLFIVDIKHMDPKKCLELTGHSNEKAFALLEHLEKRNKAVWIRNVLVPGYTDNEEHIAALCAYVQKLGNVQNFEILPYHAMAKPKYEKMGLSPKFFSVPASEPMKLEQYKRIFQKYYNKKVTF